MRIEKKVLNDALRILGKMVCQTSPAEVQSGGGIPGSAVCRHSGRCSGNGD